MNKKIRVIFTEKCYRGCPGCCNKDYNFNTYPTFKLDLQAEEIIITGGEPMLFPNELKAFIGRARALGYQRKIYMYTADVKKPNDVIKLLNHGLNGITLTLHDQADCNFFRILNNILMLAKIYDKSLRLNVFEGVELYDMPYPLWDIKKHIKWIKDCPLPKDEILMVLR